MLLGPIQSGAIILYAGTTIPSGWMECDGSAISRTKFPGLFANIGQTFGNGDGSTTFNLPDLRGKFILGHGQGSGLTNRILGQSGGNELVTIGSTDIPVHSHDMGNHTHDLANHTHTLADTSVAGTDSGFNCATSNSLAGTCPSASQTVTTSGTPSPTATSAQGGGGSHNNMQPFLVLRYLIKT